MKLYNVDVKLKSISKPDSEGWFQCVVLADDDNDVNDKIIKKFGEQLVEYKVWYDNGIVLIERKH